MALKFGFDKYIDILIWSINLYTMKWLMLFIKDVDAQKFYIRTSKNIITGLEALKEKELSK